jgi:hypothetical protein
LDLPGVFSFSLDASFSFEASFALDTGDAAAAGLAAGLALVAGVAALLGDDGVDEVDDGAVVAGVEVVLGEFELFSGSLAQAAANAIVAVARSASAIRRIRFTFGLLIVCPRPAKIEKQDDDCATKDYGQWVFPQTFRRNLRLGRSETLACKSVPARKTGAEERPGGKLRAGQVRLPDQSGRTFRCGNARRFNYSLPALEPS